MDWRAQGYADATAGFDTGRFMHYQNTCVQHGILPSRTLYLSGWRDASTPQLATRNPQ